MPAFQAGNVPCRVYFSLSKFNGASDFASVHVSVTKQNTGMNVVKTTDNVETGRYRATGIILNVARNKVEGEDDIDTAPVILSLKTGQDRIYYVLIGTVLITLAAGVVLIKKYVL